jgi:cytidine deaminase
MSPDNAIPWAELVRAATEARARAYAPYSDFQVGAALLGSDGGIYPGCNVENASYGLSLCAERNALTRAVVEGCREIRAVAVVTAAVSATPPCGACRQVLRELGRAQVPVRMVTLAGEESEHTLGELLPHAFTRDSL